MAKYIQSSTDIEVEDVENTENIQLIFADGNSIDKKIENIIGKDAITVYLPSNLTLSGNTITKLNLSSIASQKSNKFTLSDDGGIIIPQGVTDIIFSGSVYFYTGGDHNDGKNVWVYKNSTAMQKNNSRNSNNYIYVDMPVKYIKVNAGDVLYLYCQNDKSTVDGVIGGGSSNTYLTVTEI